ncbi:MAG TPA: hypothetical protein VK919_04095 [Solirubrobacterales bacterium]|nr:hypothetical protein [Solirubrobacterales bacterium]
MAASETQVGGDPKQAAVPGNRWTELSPPPAGGLGATPAVTIVVEGEGPDAELTAAALSAQTYPPDAFEVLLGDPGPAAPGGDVVIFLAAGAIPAPELVSAHVRWHLVASDAATAGPVHPLDARGLDPAAVRAAAEAGELEALFRSRPGRGEEPLRFVRDLTRNLTEPGQALYRAAAIGNVGVRAATLAAIGGGGRGGGAVARLDRAHRLACFGAVFVPEPAAACWAANAPALAAAAGIAGGADGELPSGAPAEAAALIPAAPFRKPGSPRRFRRPATVVDLDATGARAGELADAISALAGGRCGDFELRVQVAPDHPEREAIEEVVAASGRAAIGPESTESFCPSPVEVTMPGVVMPDRRTLGDLHELIVTERAGVIRVTVPGFAPDEAIVNAYASGPLARARRVAAATGEDADEVLVRLFGERWMSGVEVSLRPHGVDEAAVSEHGMLAAATDLDDERAKHLRYLKRADELADRAAIQERRLVSERLRVHAASLRADELEAKADAAGRHSE